MLFLRLVSKSKEIKKELFRLKKSNLKIHISSSQSLETALKKCRNQPTDFLLLDIYSLCLEEKNFPCCLENLFPAPPSFTILLLADMLSPWQKKFVNVNKNYLHDVFWYRQEQNSFSFSDPLFEHFIYRNYYALQNLHELQITRFHNFTLQKSLAFSSAQNKKNKNTFVFPPFFNAFIESQETKNFVADNPEVEKILLTGEPGLQQEEIARYFHWLKFKKSSAPFISLNISRIPLRQQEAILLRLLRQVSKLFVSDDNKILGTIYLEGIESIAWDLQSKLLKILHERFFTTAVSSNSTNTTSKEILPLRAFLIFSYSGDLNLLVNSGIFRQDLFFNLQDNVFCLEPVRSYKQNIEHFLSRYFKDADTLLIKKIADFFLTQECAGNVDELLALASEFLHDPSLLPNSNDAKQKLPQKLIQQDSASSSTLSDENSLTPPLQNFIREQSKRTQNQDSLFHNPNLSLEEMEKHYIAHVLQQHKGNISESSRSLGITRKTLYAKISRYNIQVG